MKRLISIVLSIILILVTAATVSADVVVGASAQLKSTYKSDYSDYRVSRLDKYLKSHNSPLSGYANVFVINADKYHLDWRLVPAIAGVESTFGKRIPKNSYNAYGWANGEYYFDSWKDSIEVVSKTLREKYLDRGAITINQIAKRYAPPSSSWAWKVEYFMNEIDSLPLEFTI